MKKRLLSLLSAVFVALGISAQVQSLDLSTLKGENAEVPDSVYLLNVEANGFLCGANAWGTQASYGPEGQLYVITEQSDGTYTLKTSSGYKAGQYLFRDNTENSFIDMGSQGHQYWNITKNEETGYYRIQTASNDEVYGVENNDNYEIEFFGWSGDLSSTVINTNISPDKEGAGLDWAFISQEVYAKMAKRISLQNAIMKCDEYGIPTESYNALVNDPNATDEQIQDAINGINARINLSKAINNAWDNGYDVPEYYQNIVEGTKETVAEVQEATNNLNARLALWEQIAIAEEAGVNINAYNSIVADLSKTTDELNETKAELIKAIDDVQIVQNAELLEGASLDDPIELFEYGIGINGDFETGNIDGWAHEMAHQNGGQYQSANYSNGSVRIEHFAESWTNGAQHSADGKFYQKIPLPAGLYTLEADMIATRQSGSKADSKGVFLFAQNTSNDEDFSVQAATGNNAPEHFSVSFVTKGGVFLIGVRAVSTTCNWIAWDNFKLYYSGPTDMPLEQINLGKTIDGIATRYNNHVEAGDNMGRVVLNDAYDAIYEAALAAYENGGLADPAEYTALGDSLTKTYNAVSASIQDYKQFRKNMDTVEETIADQQDKNAACAAELEDYMDELLDEYDKREWTRAEIDLILSTVSEIMGKYTNVQPGDDVTFYLFNPKFEKDFSGWNVVGATPGYLKNHGQGENANADLCQEVPEEEDGLAECYHAVFDMSQTIKNLPAGLYTFSVQGFDRHDDGNMESAQLYATFPDGTEQTVDIADIDDYKTEDRLYVKNNADGNAEWMSDAGRDGDTYWVPNGMSGAAWHFVNKSNGKDYDYTNKFTILMKEAGDLKVGVRVNNSHQWVIWDNFTLVYKGLGAAVWIPALQEEADNVEKRVQDAGVTTGEEDVIFDVTNKAYKMIKNIGDYTADDCLAMIEELKAQYAEITKNVNLQKQIESFYDQVYNLSEKAEELDDAELQARYEAITNLVDGDYDDLNNAEMEAKIEEIKAVIALVKMPKGWQDASDENPVDFSAMIANRYFNHDGSEDPEDEPAPVQNHNFTEWQGKQPGTGGGQPGNCGEVWNSGAFDMYQEIGGLPEGTYVLSCQGFLRHSGGTEDSYKVLNGDLNQSVYAYLYGNSSEGQYSTELCNIASVQLDQVALDSLGIDISGGNTTFGSIYKGADQLITADNFFKAGFYNNSITVKVGADGVLRVGIQKIGAVGQDWVVVDNFSLMYLGGASQAETSDDPKTAINEVETVAQKAIYTITGVRTAKATKPGLYIINGKKIVVK